MLLLDLRAVPFSSLFSLPDAHTFWPSFGAALVATLKVFAIASSGFLLVRRGWLTPQGLQGLGQLVGLLTLPCLIFYRFATRFDPQTFPDWWKYCLAGALVTVIGLILGKLVAHRHDNNDEATLLVGFQNAGFFVLPMLQALLPPRDYERGSLLLFVVFIPFNASLWLAGSWFLLKKRTLEPRIILTPTFLATVGTLILYGFFHDAMHSFDASLPVRVLLGDGTQDGAPGALQQIGDLAVPLATITLGGSVALSLRGRLTEKRAALEVAFAKLIVVPVIGLLMLPLLLGWLGRGPTSTSPHGDYVVALLLMLQFSAPPAIALSVFAQQHAFPMKLIPVASLVCYIACLITVPLFVALVPH